MPTFSDPYSKTFAVADALRETGYAIEDVGQGANALGLFYLHPKTPVETVDYLFGFLWPIKGRRRDWLATLWLDNDARNARRDSRWVIEVFGDQYFDRVLAVADRLEKRFGADIFVELTSHVRRYEHAPIDFMD